MATNLAIREFDKPVSENLDEAEAILLETKDWPIEAPLSKGIESLIIPPPSSFALGTLRDGRLRVEEPFDIGRTTDAGQCVLEATEISEFGYGENLSEALADLQAAIAELYFTLETERDRLGRDLAKVWATLSRKVRRADASQRA